jgi:hypothetical protein
MPRNSSILVIGALFGLIGLVIVAAPMFWPPTAPASVPAVQPLGPTAPTAPTAPSVDIPPSVVEAVSRTVLFAGAISAVVCAALFGLAVIVHRRFMRRRMALTGQSARMFMQTSDAETREANARVIAALAAEGAAPTGFGALVGAGGQADRDAAVLVFLQAQGSAGATLEELAASVGGSRLRLWWVLRRLCRHNQVQRIGARYRVPQLEQMS